MTLRNSLLPLLLAAVCAVGASAQSNAVSRTRTVGDLTFQRTLYDNGYRQGTVYGPEGNAVYRGEDGQGGTFRGAYNGETGNVRQVGTYEDGTKYRARGHWNADTNTGRSVAVDENGNRSAWWSSYQTQSRSVGNRTRSRITSVASGSRTIPASE